MKLPRQNQRRGSVALLFVLVLALMASALAISITRRESAQRRSEAERFTVATLQSAIVAVEQAELIDESPIRLPVDERTSRWIIIERLPGEKNLTQWQASMIHDEIVVASIRRMAQE